MHRLNKVGENGRALQQIFPVPVISCLSGLRRWSHVHPRMIEEEVHGIRLTSKERHSHDANQERKAQSK